MPWNLDRSRGRIAQLMRNVPETNVRVRTFDEGYLSTRRAEAQARGRALRLDENVIVDIPTNQAILVDGVHVYVQLIDYHDALVEQGRETEASHRRVLEFLHLHYVAADGVIGTFEAQRVDYHGPRIHAVVVTPTGSERDRVVKAVEMATALTLTIEEAGAEFGDQRLRTRVRIGIDTGRAIAVNSGRGAEPEPLFLGAPANYAAKLAEGDQPGIFLSARARRVVGMPVLGSLLNERAVAVTSVDEARLASFGPGWTGLGASATPARQRANVALASLREDVRAGRVLGTRAVFRFHHHEPPLRTIDFADLMPSNSIRMPLMSVFADLDGFTAYVDTSIRGGAVAIRQMVANLHVIRGEFVFVARDDFGGRKVRFIGDCLHGIVAEGDRTDTDRMASVMSAVRLAGGLRSSFELCQSLLPGIRELGLAIGLELGATPVTRLGIRGERSVRCASSKAVSASEGMQGECTGTQTRLGPNAFAAAPARVRTMFPNGVAEDLDYEAVSVMLDSALSAPAVVASQPRPEFRAHGGS